MVDTSKDLNTIIRIETLLNAHNHDGKPQLKTIIGKILGNNPEFRKEAKTVKEYIEAEIQRISLLSHEQITEELVSLDPEAIQVEKDIQQSIIDEHEDKRLNLPDLPNAKKGEFKVRYAPDPSKYPHLGQAINYLINRMYADKYDGKVLLRFDDTNPTIVKQEYYEAIKDGLLWLGAEWDEEVNASELIEEFYDVAFNLIKENHFYVCFCDGPSLSKNREKGIACNHRDQTASENEALFTNMIDGKYESGSAILRLRGDLESENNVMRDPVLYRIVSDKHPMLKKFYHVFPTYDMESSYLEAKMKVTHVIRSGEFGTMRQELQSYLIELMGGKVPEFIQFGRVNIQGSPTRGRVIRELVTKKVVSGWDDIRLITLVGLKKRGIHPQTPRIIVREAGLSPQNTRIAWSTIEKKSRELLAPEARRIFFVEDPIEIRLVDADKITVNFPYHPDHQDYGVRELSIDGRIFVSKSDVEHYSIGSVFRLKDLFNIEILQLNPFYLTAKNVGNEIVRKMAKIQWVGENYLEGALDVPLPLIDEKGRIDENSMAKISGYFEPDVEKILPEEVVQLERVGFAKVKVENSHVSGHIVHLY